MTPPIQLSARRETESVVDEVEFGLPDEHAYRAVAGLSASELVELEDANKANPMWKKTSL